MSETGVFLPFYAKRRRYIDARFCDSLCNSGVKERVKKGVLEAKDFYADVCAGAQRCVYVCVCVSVRYSSGCVATAMALTAHCLAAGRVRVVSRSCPGRVRVVSG